MPPNVASIELDLSHRVILKPQKVLGDSFDDLNSNISSAVVCVERDNSFGCSNGPLSKAESGWEISKNEDCGGNETSGGRRGSDDGPSDPNGVVGREKSDWNHCGNTSALLPASLSMRILSLYFLLTILCPMNG